METEGQEGETRRKDDGDQVGDEKERRAAYHGELGGPDAVADDTERRNQSGGDGDTGQGGGDFFAADGVAGRRA